MDNRENREILDKCKELGIETDINKRWEGGISHHPKAEEIFEMLSISDWVFGDDYFCWKSGGDGDNGEALMFSLSIYLEYLDRIKESLAKTKELDKSCTI